jgi:hypothetical protein
MDFIQFNGSFNSMVHSIQWFIQFNASLLGGLPAVLNIATNGLPYFASSTIDK